MNELKLYMIMLGAKPEGRFTEQHDIFFGIGKTMADLKPAMQDFWKEASVIHVDAWREVNAVNGYRISVVERQDAVHERSHQLFFINLGGYRENEFEEFHYKVLAVAATSGEAISISKETAFFKHTAFAGAASHIDDKYGVDVDDIVNIEEILSARYKSRYCLQIVHTGEPAEDPMHPGFLKWNKI